MSALTSLLDFPNPVNETSARVVAAGVVTMAAATIMLGGLLGAASLEAFFGICLACKLFPALVKLGVVPESACEQCADIWSRKTPAVIA